MSGRDLRYAAFDSSGQTLDDPTVAVSPPLDLSRFPSVTAEPSHGLLDGDTMRSAHGASGGRRRHPASHADRVAGRHQCGYCRTECVITLQPLASVGEVATGGDGTLLGAFVHRSIAPPARGVTIVGSTLDTEVEVKATASRILGPTDCTAVSGACVLPRRGLAVRIDRYRGFAAMCRSEGSRGCRRLLSASIHTEADRPR